MPSILISHSYKKWTLDQPFLKIIKKLFPKKMIQFVFVSHIHNQNRNRKCLIFFLESHKCLKCAKEKIEQFRTEKIDVGIVPDISVISNRRL